MPKGNGKAKQSLKKKSPKPPQNKVTIPKATLKKVPSYTSLEKRIVAVGKAARKRDVGHVAAASEPLPKGYHTGKIETLLANETYKDKKKFGSKYRKISDGQDELVSTSTVRSLLTGLKPDPAAKEFKEIVAIFEDVSCIRYPTEVSGFNLSDTERMQHPTSEGGGIYSLRGETESPHNFLDRERQAEVAAAMEEKLKDKSAKLSDIVSAGVRAAISHSLNCFDAPPTASDIRTIRPDVDMEAITEHREKLKTAHEEHGGIVEAGDDTRMGRPWKKRRMGYKTGNRSVSPRRKPCTQSPQTLAPAAKPPPAKKKKTNSLAP